MKITIKLGIITLAVLISTAIFYSCKKTATDEANPQSELLESFKKKYKDEPISSTYILNMKGTGYYGDINGNRINIIPGQSNRSDGTSCPEPGSSEISQIIFSMTRERVCGLWSRFVVQFKVVSEFYPQMTNGSGLPSKGRIKLLNSSGVQVYITPASTINPVISIQNNGVVGHTSDPTDPHDLNEFIITYRSENIPESIYSQSASVQSNLFCYTDCTNYPTITIPFSSQQQVLNAQWDLLPCSRIDRVYWNQSTGLGASTGGCNYVPSSCFPPNYVFPDKQEIQIYANGLWQPIQLWRSASGGGTEQPAIVGLISPIDVWFISMTGYTGGSSTISAGTYSVRYRNNHTGSTSNGGPCVTQPDPTWITESWYISI